MNNEIKEKIRNFYNPQLKYNNSVLVLTVNGQEKSVSLSDKPIYLGFGEKANSEQEAEEKGFVKTNGMELFKTFFPEKWEEIKNRYEDNRTEKYLQAVKDNIGLVNIKHGWDAEKLNNSITMYMFLNTSDIEIGQNENEEWVVQFSRRIDIDDYDITRLYFSRKPKEKDIKTAVLIDNIQSYFRVDGFDKVYFTCWECGHKKHWLDIGGDLQEKWERYLDKYCGC